MAMLMTATPLVSQNYGVVFGDLEVTAENAADIFGDGMASYDVEGNGLVLRDGFGYNLSHGLVEIHTGNEFHVVLEGNAKFAASISSDDPIVVETVGDGYLKITSNISGSALKCKSLTLQPKVFLDLLSRNSQNNMYALDCEELTVNAAILHAEVTTAELAVHTSVMNLKECWLQKPRGGGLNDSYGGICYADGLPAKQVRIIVEGFGVEEILQPEPQVEKVFENGSIVIIKDGKKYDITGREL